MRNYVILNGKHSKEIEGLLISTLPHISKPKMRVENLEIDGRAGDIITNLGYGSYEKSFDIGLTYNWDIDEVVNYFSESGTVIFSNEPDKYYKYNIIEQIDYERLGRFKKATVKMWVQPFKYSASENRRAYSAEANMLAIPQFFKTTNGIVLTVSHNVVSMSGTSTASTEILIPINALILKKGDYVLSVKSSGSNASALTMRLLKGIDPSNADSFGSNYLTLADDSTVSLQSTITDEDIYNRLWLSIPANQTLNVTLDVSVMNAIPNIVVRNSGNIVAKPIVTIIGNGIITLKLNGNAIFALDMRSTSIIFIDTEEMNAYYQDGSYANRIVLGNYDDFALRPGVNVITWDGNLTELSVYNYSRWL